ncbi:hypothetical protein M885DRAFT_506454 [Pelagophyceae sp. CCMP2097]|nr:hypothetical protein M885DRAFT_506454 [Pelagophyceae sp. CCMP2097]
MGSGGSKKASPKRRTSSEARLAQERAYQDMSQEQLQVVTQEKMASGLYRECAIRPSLRDDTGAAKNDLFSLYEKMEEILKNEDELRDFSAFLLKQHAEEWVQFYLEVEHYAEKFVYIDQELASFADAVETNLHVATPEEFEEKKVECMKIYHKYIAAGGEAEINLSAKAKKGVLKAIQEGHYEPRVFRIAMKCVIEQLTKERLHHFVIEQKNSRDVWLTNLKHMDQHRHSIRNGAETAETTKNVQSCVRLSKQIDRVLKEVIDERRASQQLEAASPQKGEQLDAGAQIAQNAAKEAAAKEAAAK